MNYLQTENMEKGPAQDGFGAFIGAVLGAVIFALADVGVRSFLLDLFRKDVLYHNLIGYLELNDLLWISLSSGIGGWILWCTGIEFLGIFGQLLIAAPMLWYYLTFKVRDEWIPIGIVLAVTVLYPLGQYLIYLPLFDAVPDISLARILLPPMANGWIRYSWGVIATFTLAGVFSRPRY